MKSLKAVLLAFWLGSVAFAQLPPTQHEVTVEKDQTITGKKTFSPGVTLGPILFSALNTTPPQTNGTIVAVSDASATSPCTGGGAGAFAKRINGAWDCSGGGGSAADFASPPPLGNVAPNTVGATTVTVNGSGLFFQPQSNCIFEGSDPTLHELEDVSGNLMWLYQGLGGPCTQIMTYTPPPDGVNPSDKQVIAYDLASGAWTVQSQSGSGNPAFSALTSASNTTAAMTVGTGASMNTSGTGSIQATGLPSSTVASLPINLPTNTLYEVTDAAQFGNCTTGGGSGRALCRWNGASWESIGGSTATSAYYALANGLVCDNATDDTAALNTLTASMNTAGGGTLIFPHGKTCKFSSAEITLPNNADSWTDSPGTISSQAPLRWTCDAENVNFQQLMSTGATLAQIQNACVLNFTFNATDAKLVSLGMGLFEMDHLALVDTAADCAPFVLVTNTMPFFHDNAVIGSTKSVTSGPYSCNDGFVIGGTGTTPGKIASSPFQGYAGARIEHNFFNQIQRAVNLQTYADTLHIADNTVWSQSGCATCGALESNGNATSTNYGNLFENNNIETSHYLYGLNFPNANSSSTSVIGQNCSDSSEFSTICVGNTGAAPGILVIGGSATGYMIGPSDVTTTFFMPQPSGLTVDAATFRWNGFESFVENSGSPSGVTLESIWGDSFYQRMVMNNHNAGKLRIAAVEEIPTTKTSTASDTFTRANAGTLGANWTAITGTSGSLQIVSNTARSVTTNAFYGNFYSAITFPADQWSQCTVGSVASRNNSYMLCGVRIQSGAFSGYVLMVTTDGSGQCTIRKYAAATPTDLFTCTAIHTPTTAADIFTLTVVGNTLTAYENGKQIGTVTDSTYTSGSPGLLADASNSGTIADIPFTGWSGGYMNCPTGVVTGLVLGSPATCTQSPALVGLTVSGGAVDASGATSIKLPVAPGFVTTAQGNMGYDSTALNWHVWQNAADRLMAVINGAVTNNDCAKFVVSGSTVSLQDAGACGGGGTTTNPLTVNNSNSGAASGTTFDGSVARTISTNTIGAPNLATANTFGAFLQDFSASTIKLPFGAGFTTTANGNMGYDSTNLNWHIWQNGADRIAGVINGSTTNGDCSKFVVAGSTVSLQDSGAGCGPGSVSQLWLPGGTPNEVPIVPAAQTGQGANVLGCIQFVPTNGITATKISVAVNTLSAAQTFNVGIYDNSLNLVRDSGTFSCGTGGGVALSNTVSSFALTSGATYYACTAFSDTVCAIQGISPAAGYANIANKNATRNFTCANALSAGAMPSACGVQTPVLGKEYIVLLEQ